MNVTSRSSIAAPYGVFGGTSSEPISEEYHELPLRAVLKRIAEGMAARARAATRATALGGRRRVR